METRIRTIKEKRDNSLEISFCSYIPYILESMAIAIAIYYGKDRIAWGVIGAVIVSILMQIMAILFHFIVKSESEVKKYTVTEKIIEAKDGNKWVKLKGVEIDD